MLTIHLFSSLLTYVVFVAIVFYPLNTLVLSYRVLIRPHPAIWRLVHGMAVIYLVALTFLLFQVGWLEELCFLTFMLMNQ